jgi:hypothetical protein
MFSQLHITIDNSSVSAKESDIMSATFRTTEDIDFESKTHHTPGHKYDT